MIYPCGKIYAEVEQGSAEWHALRLGKVTASRIADVLARTKSGYGAGRKNYLAELVVERMTGETPPSFTNEAMRWGIETEPQARAMYEFDMDVEVIEIAFCDHFEIEMSGASPDGLVGDDGLVEIKCPKTSTHIDTILSPKIAPQYLLQMQWQMACLGRQWCDFVSFDPRMPSNLQMYCRRVYRDQNKIDEIEEEVNKFLEELHGTIAKLQEISL